MRWRRIRNSRRAVGVVWMPAARVHGYPHSTLNRSCCSFHAGAQAWRRSLTTFAAILGGLVGPDGDGAESAEDRLTSAGLAGALTGMYLAHRGGAVDTDRDQIVARGVELVERSAAASGRH